VASGQRVRVVDLEGAQVGDVFAFARNDLSDPDPRVVLVVVG
jgi:uncharacterized protein YcgI (DUF1989 family)